MQLDKTAFGYTLLKNTANQKAADSNLGELTQDHLQFISGLVRRLRNLFLSVIPADYCCIMLAGAYDQPDSSCHESGEVKIESLSLKYLDQDIGLIKYHTLDDIANDDKAKIEMLADLFSYLIYHHLMMYEIILDQKK